MVIDQPLKRRTKLTPQTLPSNGFTTVLKIQPCSLHFAGQENCSGSRSLVQPSQIKGVGTLSSISWKKTNIYSLFNKQPGQRRWHGKRHFNKRAPQLDVAMSTLVDLVDMIDKPEGVHKINTKLFSISSPQIRGLQELALESTNFDYSSAEHRVIAIILDIANYRLFRPVRSDVPAEKPKHFMKIKFLNKAVDAINLPALLRSTSVTDKIPVYFRDKEPLVVSYEYISTVASKIFNFAPTLSNLNVSENSL